MVPRRGLDIHVCQSSFIPAHSDHKYTFMPPRDMIKETVYPSLAWTSMAIVFINDKGEV